MTVKIKCTQNLTEVHLDLYDPMKSALMHAWAWNG